MKDQDNIKTTIKDRIYGLDFLRGLFIVMAIFQHYCGYLNYWYVDFFHREMPAWESFYASHLSMAGKQLPMDTLSTLLTTYLVPWVSQIYLAMAAFNLSRKPQNEFSPTLNSKLALFGGCYLALVCESLLIAPNFGEAISFYPVMLWMVLLALFSVVYSRFGINGMLMLIPIAAICSFNLDHSLFTPAETWVQTHIHEDFEIDSHFDEFMLSGCFGFVYGWFWHHSMAGKKVVNRITAITSVCALIIYLLFGELPVIDRFDIYAHEHDMSQSIINYLGILGMEFIVLSSVLILYQKNIRLKWNPVNWIGVYSLPIFLLHKIIFVHFWGPLLLMVTAKMNCQLVNDFWLLAGLTITTIVIVYGITKIGAVSLPFSEQCKKQWKAHYRNTDQPSSESSEIKKNPLSSIPGFRHFL